MTDIERLYTPRGRAELADLRDLHREALRHARIYRGNRFPIHTSLIGSGSAYWIDQAGKYRRLIAQTKHRQSRIIARELAAHVSDMWRMPKPAWTRETA